MIIIGYDYKRGVAWIRRVSRAFCSRVGLFYKV